MRKIIHAEPVVKEDANARLEERELEERGKRSQLRTAALARREKHREEYTPRLYWVLVSWLVFLGVVTLLDGASSPALGWIVQFDVPESVLIALITGATINVFAVFSPIVKDLFPTRTRADDDWDM